MPRALTLALTNMSTHAMHVPLTTTRLVTVAVTRPEVPSTVVGLNPTETTAWNKAIATPPVAQWIASGELTVQTITQTAEDDRRETI